MVKYLGSTENPIHVVITKDSSASISIVKGFNKSIGAKQYLQPEVEAGMELFMLRKQHTKVTYETVKVNSHIDQIDAPNERYLELNEFTDHLATSAREKV